MSKKKKEEGDPDQPYPNQLDEQSQEDQQEGPNGSEERQSDDAPESEEPSTDELTPYQPRHRPLQNAGVDHHAAEIERESERQAQREEHNRRVGDSSRR